MNRQKWILASVALLMMAAAAVMLVRLKASQRLGAPGIRAKPIPDSQRMEIYLPERVPGYTSEATKPDPIAFEGLPHDTSFGQRRYTASNGFWLDLNVVMMGSDRTSIHKPQYCLRGSGWQIDTSEHTSVMMRRPYAYALPVMKLTASREVMMNGQQTRVRGIYMYWFVADHALTADHWERMWWMARDLLKSGVLPRTAYITCFAACLPGLEDSTYERMKAFMADAVPEFQLAAGSPAKGGAVAGGHPGASPAPAR